jgi:NAD(P)-dependent dehydrogenase (short-subunit alcohol dehydrogenase family)
VDEGVMAGLVEGKVAVVTGGGSGIGEAAARLFAAEGAAVLVADRNADAAATVAEALVATGADAVAVTTDVTDEGSVEAMVAAGVQRWGRIDCAFNNAGISGAMTAFTELSLSDFETMIRINLVGVFLSMRAELRVMAPRKAGAIVNTSSGAGVVGFAGLPHYVAAKHGVIGLTKTAAQEYARVGIRVNAVLPGTTATPMIRGFIGDDANLATMMNRSVARGTMGEPIEVAQAAVWLCSDRASFVSGESMLVDGGSVCR